MRGPVGLRGVTWLVWRQHRAVRWALLTGSVLVAGFFLIGGYGAADAVTPRLSECAGAAAEKSRECVELLKEFQQQHQYPLRRPLQVLVLLPFVFGLFLGAPLFAQELESGTYRTVLSQSVTRTRWFLAKLAVPAALTVLFGGLVTAAATWWWHTIDGPVGSGFPWYGPMPYDAIGPAPVAKSLLLLLAGVTSSLLIRRTVAAMGATVVVGAVLLYALEQVRGALWPVRVAQARGGAVPVPDGAWLRAEGLLSATGQRVPDASACLSAGDYEQCLARRGVTGEWAEYHPTSHLWPLQWMETGVCLAAAGVLALFCFWWTRRRLT
ncbi:ABC transporter permease subunit [Streptomyces sp. NPDC006512]|uniref:ABC transporter permease subunit n=1 Tax=Streptomyces sp. NPDC006512 TaxID=3154307 RepID=UPI0033A0AF1E